MIKEVARLLVAANERALAAESGGSRDEARQAPVDASYIAPRLSVGNDRETTRWERRIRGTEVLITWFPLGNCRIRFENWGRSPWWLPEYTIPIS